uniref:Uncharacterized protein n=1 Tax=viral metagenome TaxID=1070528 RepID=A0A6M3LHP9_9ZZZZ
MAFTAAKMFETVIDGRIFGGYKLTGDGSDTTWTAPVGILDAAWINTATADAGTSISFATNVVTFDGALETHEYVHVYYVGV